MDLCDNLANLVDLFKFTLLQIILSQEKNIQKLNELVQTLREQLLQCKGETGANGSSNPLTEVLTDPERHPILEG